MGTHYVCTGGCNGMSDDAGATCRAEGCPKHGQPMTACGCTDGQHQEAHDSTTSQEGASDGNA